MSKTTVRYEWSDFLFAGLSGHYGYTSTHQKAERELERYIGSLSKLVCRADIRTGTEFFYSSAADAARLGSAHGLIRRVVVGGK